jgi:hypothetical protein
MYLVQYVSTTKMTLEEEDEKNGQTGRK